MVGSFFSRGTSKKGPRGAVGSGFCHQALYWYPQGIPQLEISHQGHLKHLRSPSGENLQWALDAGIFSGAQWIPWDNSLTLALLDSLHWYILLRNPKGWILTCSGQLPHQLGGFHTQLFCKTGSQVSYNLCRAYCHERLKMIWRKECEFRANVLVLREYCKNRRTYPCWKVTVCVSNF